jgi:hypothetical protein
MLPEPLFGLCPVSVHNNIKFLVNLMGLGRAAIMLFAEIARSQASSRPPVGHILRRLIVSYPALRLAQLSKKAAEGCVSIYVQ